MPGEVLAIENIEKASKEMKKEEVDAINTINDFLGKNKWDDEAIKQLQWDILEIPENIKEMKDIYNKVKDRVKFSEAYSNDEYISYKKDIVYYLKNNMGKWYNEASETSLYKINPVMIQTKLFEYNTSKNGIEKPINIPKFMTNFYAERIAYTKFTSINGTEWESKQQNKEHKTGKILEFTDAEKQWINDKVNMVINDNFLDLRIIGQANGVLPENPDGIKETYNTLRAQVFNECDDKIKTELGKIFPEFNEKNFSKDNPDTWNMGYAMSRVLKILSVMDANQKNKLFASEEWSANIFKKDNKNIYASLGEVKFIFRAVEEKWDEYTLWNIEVEPTKSKIKEIIKKNADTILKQLNSTSITFEIDYEGKKDKYVWSSFLTKYVGKTMRAYEFINTATDIEQKREKEAFSGDSDPYFKDAYDVKDYHKNMNIKIPYSDIGKYPEFITKDGDKIYTNPMSFKDALRFYKIVNKDNQRAIDYAQRTEDMLENFEYLNTYINNNPDIKEDLAKEVVKGRHGEENSTTRTLLTMLGAKFIGGNEVKIGNMVYTATKE